MAELTSLWRRRRADNFQMQLRYWNLIGKNSGLMFVLYAMVIIGGFYYKRWLDGLPNDFPGELLVSFVLSVPAVRSPIRTFTQHADTVFLLPVEAELGGYFRLSRLYSFIIQSILLIFILLLCAPLYFHSPGGSSASYFAAAGAVFAVKWWNIDCRWQEQSIDFTLPLKILRSGLSFMLIYAVIAGLNLAVPAACLIIMLLSAVFLFRRQASRSLLNWDHVIDMEDKEGMQFLRFANLFTDVPRLKRSVRPRWLISGFFPVRSFGDKQVYDQLFIKTFIRADDYFGIYLRLTAIGMLICFFINNGIYTVFVVAAMVYLTGLQLLPLWSHPFPQALTGMYPVADRVKRLSFVRLLFAELAVQCAVLSAAGAIGMRSALSFPAFLAAGLIAGGLFSFGYARRRFAKEEQ